VCSLRDGRELLPPAKELKYLRVLLMSEGKMEREMDRRIGAASGKNAGAVQIRCGEEGAEPEGEALDLPVHLRSNPDLWSRALGSDQNKEITDTSGQNEFPQCG